MSETRQSYNNNLSLQRISKKILLSAIDYLRHKVEHDALSVSEAERLMRFFCENLNLQGPTDDFARFYGKSKNNVKVVICRNMMATPIKKILYPFAKFARAIPPSWIDGVESQK